MNLFWHNDSSTLYEGTPEQPGEMLGWCYSPDDRHTRDRWFAEVVGQGLIPRSNEYNAIMQWYWPDECMARQAVLDAVTKEKS